jgi:hypothetical protein
MGALLRRAFDAELKRVRTISAVREEQPVDRDTRG